MKQFSKSRRNQPLRYLIGSIRRFALGLDPDLIFIRSMPRLRKMIIQDLLDSIRYHRDQRGDDRCWFDDFTIYWRLPEAPRQPIELSRGKMASLCAHYSACRRSEEAPKGRLVEAQQADLDPNAYLSSMNLRQLRQEARRLRQALRKHKQAGDKRTRADDELLYTALPDGIVSDGRLPPEDRFLPNCRLICSMVDEKNVDLSKWPNGWISPLADWYKKEMMIRRDA